MTTNIVPGIRFHVGPFTREREYVYKGRTLCGVRLVYRLRGVAVWRTRWIPYSCQLKGN